MKSILAIGSALFIALALVPLREWTELDTLRAPVNRWLWLRSEIVRTPSRRIDYAFTGSSKTLSAIRPEHFTERYPGTVVYNFAHFGWAHDADYFIAKALLERHDVSTLVVEIPRVPPREAHGETVHLVGVADLSHEARIAIAEVASGGAAAVRGPLSRLFRYTTTALLSFPRHVLEWLPARLTGDLWEYQRSAGYWEDHNGFASPLERLQPDEAFRARQRARPPKIPTHPAWPRYAGGPEPTPGPRDDAYLSRLRALAEEHETRLVFLYIPPWQKRLPSRQQHDYYAGFGEVLIPDLRKFDVPEYYIDPLHLYREGTLVLTDDVARLLVEGTADSPYRDLYRDLPD